MISFIRQCFKLVVPPLCVTVLRNLQSFFSCPKDEGRPSLEYVREGWSYKCLAEEGWNHESIARVEKEKWDQFIHFMQGTDPLGVAHEARELKNTGIESHNNIMSFGYVLGVAAYGKQALSILDWGGGLGHYYLFAKALMPQLKLTYTCKDVPSFCRLGKELLPEVFFVEDSKDFLSKKYDFAFVSASFQYSENWKKLLVFLAQRASYVFITRLPIVSESSSYVIVQRAYEYGYQAEYLGWVLNRNEFLSFAAQSGLKLIREFLVAERHEIVGAPEQPIFSGFLFCK